MTLQSLAYVLARCLLGGPPDREQTIARCDALWDTPSPRWIRPLVRRFGETFEKGVRPQQREVVRFVLQDPAFRRAWSRDGQKLSPQHWLTESPTMRPVPTARAWNLPAIASAGELADWLWLEPGDLDWFADLKCLGSKSSSQAMQHYRYRLFAKETGGIRLIEAPKPRLKKLQREILAGILESIPVHAAAHGFVRGRSIQTFAAPHVGQPVVLRMDVRNFFPAFSAARVQALFRLLGYPESVANHLGGICTNATPRALLVEADPETRELYRRRHLPQGAATSPALANICFFRIDGRLHGLARSADASYTRYADDLAFSGGAGFARHAELFSRHVAAILQEEGYEVNHRKTRMMRAGVRQYLAGMVINQRTNVTRHDFDQLKATLTNCARFGADGQNREAHPFFREHLQGRVAFVEMIHAERGRKLRQIFNRISWA